MTKPTEYLAPYRDRINALDEEIVRLLAQRLEVCSEVAREKRAHGIAMMQPDRVEAVKARCAELGAAKGLRPEFMKDLYARIIREACDLEDRIIGR